MGSRIRIEKTEENGFYIDALCDEFEWDALGRTKKSALNKLHKEIAKSINSEYRAIMRLEKMRKKVEARLIKEEKA